MPILPTTDDVTDGRVAACGRRAAAIADMLPGRPGPGATQFARAPAAKKVERAEAAGQAFGRAV